MSTNKPKLSFSQIFNMSFGFLGIQFGFALQNANVSRIFESLGAKESDIAGLWLAAPITGLLMQPIIGYMSDRTWHPTFGRRRPYFLFGAIFASIALILMPNSSTLWMAAGLLWVLDASINISMEPFRAFVGDKLPPEQRTMGFAMQSLFIGLGAVIASALPWLLIHVFKIDLAGDTGTVPYNVKLSFYIGAGAFLVAVLWTVFTSKEYPLTEEEAHEKLERVPKVIKYGPALYQRRGLILTGIGVISAVIFYTLMLSPDSPFHRELYVLSFIFCLFGLAYFGASIFMFKKRYDNSFVQIVRDFQNMPKTMMQLANVQFFTWFALFSMWIYMTPAVSSHIYNALPNTPEYNEAGDWVGICFAVYNVVAFLFALLLPVLSDKFSRKMTHLICLTLGGLGLISVFFITDKNMLLLSMVGVGIAWTSILSIPYAMLTGSLPTNKIGYYMGIFNFFIVIPQIVAASILGLLVSTLFKGHSVYALVLGGVCLIIAGLFTLRVQDDDKVYLPLKNV